MRRTAHFGLSQEDEARNGNVIKRIAFPPFPDEMGRYRKGEKEGEKTKRPFSSKARTWKRIFLAIWTRVDENSRNITVPARISPLGTSAFREFFSNFTELSKCCKCGGYSAPFFLRNYGGGQKNSFFHFWLFLTKILVTGWPKFTHMFALVIPTNLIE